MPRPPGESDQHAHAREPYFAILARIDRNKDFFERLFKLHPRFMALFGVETEAIFMKIHAARRTIEVSASMLMRTINSGGEWNENRERQREQWECDIWAGMDEVIENRPEAKRVANGVTGFRDDIIQICKPVIEQRSKGSVGRFFSWNS
jgi:hypothetical protein